MNRSRRRTETAWNRRRVDYRHRLLVAQPSLETLRGKVMRAVVAHDAWCAIYAGFGCNCQPDITVHPQNGGAVLVIDDAGQVRKVRKQ